MTTTRFHRAAGHGATGTEHTGHGRETQLPRRLLRLRRERPGRDALATVLLIDPVDRRRLIARSDRRWTRILARLFSSSLDRRIAAGCSTDSSRLLATRAQVLVSSDVRLRLAGDWERLLNRARMPRGARDPRVTLNRDFIVAHERDIERLTAALLVALPTPARGVAMASSLLGDGTGPLFNRRRATDIGAALGNVIAQLDPSASLV